MNSTRRCNAHAVPILKSRVKNRDFSCLPFTLAKTAVFYEEFQKTPLRRSDFSGEVFRFVVGMLPSNFHPKAGVLEKPRFLLCSVNAPIAIILENVDV